jgi:hypothetical protein
MRHLVCNVRYSVVPISSSLLTCTFFSSVRTTVIYNNTKHLLVKFTSRSVSCARPFCAIRKPHLTHAHAPADTAYCKVKLISTFFSEPAVNGASDLDKKNCMRFHSYHLELSSSKTVHRFNTVTSWRATLITWWIGGRSGEKPSCFASYVNRLNHFAVFFPVHL